MAQKDLHVIVGLGITGLSCARFLAQQQIPFAVMDTRTNPPNVEEFKKLFPEVELSLGTLNEDLLNTATQLIISPGISVKTPIIAKQMARGIPVIGDIELFARATNKPIIAITGTNAKSTVTSLVGEMAKSANLKPAVGGNLGMPALQLLTDPEANVFVLELSSFQLETTQSLKARVATVLNITPDHMDRYQTLEDYRRAKHQIYLDCTTAVCNKDDPLTDCHKSGKKINFTLQRPGEAEFGLITLNQEVHLAYEDQVLLPVRELPILGRHYQANALAALAIGHGFGLAFEPMIQTLLTFQGLPHRCQLIRERFGIRWYNDSKGTNVGATLAAIEGFGNQIDGKLILIAGGVGKSADFSPLAPSIAKFVRTVILLGEAAHDIAAVLDNNVDRIFVDSLNSAVTAADKVAKKGDCVLLSPACASFDMFKNFEHRGDVFMEIVKQL